MYSFSVFGKYECVAIIGVNVVKVPLSEFKVIITLVTPSTKREGFESPEDTAS